MWNKTKKSRGIGFRFRWTGWLILVAGMTMFCPWGLPHALAQGLTEAEIQARIAALSQKSMKSADGNFIIVGTNRLESFALARWCDNAVTRIALITGIKPRFGGRKISVTVDEKAQSGRDSARIVYGPADGAFVARVFLGSYRAAYKVRGRQAICCAILALYVKDSSRGMLDMPPWLWMGIEENLLFDVRSRNLEQVLSLWRDAKLPLLLPLLADRSITPQPAIRLKVYSAFVHFIMSQPEHRKIFRQLFVLKKDEFTPAKLKDVICGSAADYDLEEGWERWLLRQSQVVRTTAIVSTRSIDQLRSELVLYPGSCGIPLEAGLKAGAPFDELVKFRNAPWLPDFIIKKQGRLNMIAAGHNGILKQVVKRFNDYLSGLETDATNSLLLRRLDNAYTALKVMADTVEQAGGMIYEKPPAVPPMLRTEQK